MTFKFSWLCELFEELDQNRLAKLSTSARASDLDAATVLRFFNRYSSRIKRTGLDGVAFLSCVFPERRTDRVYNIQETRLAAIFGRALGLSASRAAQLNAWKNGRGADFASCIEEVMRAAENRIPSPKSAVTIIEIDTVLHQIAANCSYSSPEVRKDQNSRSSFSLLDPILKRLHSSQAKWFVRMILKCYSPIVIPERVTMTQFHFLLPSILCVQNNLVAAIAWLSGPEISKLPPRLAQEDESAYRQIAESEMKPQVGIMIQRQPYDKARSVKHCCKMVGRRIMSIERKYDGEYCQIHVDLSKKEQCIQIFSKSGKDSTADRIRLHAAIEDALSLGTNNCKVKSKCILEGELLIWSEPRQAIQPFYKIRQHVQHGGRWLGNEAGSQAAHDEHPMIMLYDLLLLDDIFYIYKPHSERRAVLKKIIVQRQGFAEVIEQQLVDFSSRSAVDRLKIAFDKCLSRGWEGLVLKGTADSYCSWSVRSRAIKLKKDYIPGLGDTVDLAVVGAHRDPEVERRLGLGKLNWTTFYLGALDNKDAVRRFNQFPHFKVLDTLALHGIPKNDLAILNGRGKFAQIPYEGETTGHCADFKVSFGGNVTTRPTSLFRKPFIVETVGSGFDKPPNVKFFALRFPRITKIHYDRGIQDVIGFEELQEIAKAAVYIDTDDGSQPRTELVGKWHNVVDRDGYVVDRSQSTTPRRSPTSATTASISPCIGPEWHGSPFMTMDSGEVSPLKNSERQPTQSHGSQRVMVASPNVTSRFKRKMSPVDDNLDRSAARKHVKLTPLEARASQLSPANQILLQSSAEAMAAKTVSVDNVVIAGECSTTSQNAGLHTTAGFLKGPSRYCPANALRTTLVTASPAAFPNLDQPLCEITNSQVQRRKRLSTLGASVIAKSHTDQGIHSTPQTQGEGLQLSFQKQAVGGRVTSPETHLKMQNLPTPPASSVENIQGSRCRPPLAFSESVFINERNKDDPRMTSIPVADIPEPIVGLRRTTIILLSRSISCLDPLESQNLLSKLRDLSSCFTYSPDLFCRQIIFSQNATKRVGLVVVDSTYSESVGRDILELAHALHDSLDATAGEPDLPTQQMGSIVFLDFNVLKLPTISRGLLRKREAAQFFSGCLRWSLNVPTEGSKVDIRAVWDWEEACTKLDI